ncbi:MAG: hypothetical protein ACKO7B_12170 [Flavobacteriales bacterium]
MRHSSNSGNGNRRKSADEIRSAWQPGLDKYKLMRKKYLMYPDFE